MRDITYHNQDITMKLVAEMLKGKSFEPFGLPDIRIREVLPTNLPAIEANELRMDHLFLLEDESLAIVDYESTYSKKDVLKYINYIARILKKYFREHHGKLPQIHLVVIYSADIEKISTAVFDFGCIRLVIEAAFMKRLETDKIYRKIIEKTRRGEALDDAEMLELIVLPLTVKGERQQQEMAAKAIELAKILPDEKQSLSALSGILTFSDKILDQEFAKKIKEEIKMTKVVQMIFNDGVESGVAQGIKALIETYQEFGISREDSVTKVMQKFSVSQEEAKEYVKKYW